MIPRDSKDSTQNCSRRCVEMHQYDERCELGPIGMEFGRRAPAPRRQRSRVSIILLVLALSVLALVGLQGTARAQEGPMGNPADPDSTWDTVWDTVWNGPALPGSDEACKATPPKVQDPRGPWAGAFMADPMKVELLAEPAPAGIWERKGTAGLQSFTFDTGCGVDPETLSNKLGASVDTGYANRLVQIGLTATAAADYLDRLSWDPTWVASFFGDLSRTLLDAIRAAVVVPWIVIGLAFTSVVLLWRARRGATSLVAGSVLWAVAVLGGVALVLSSPLVLSQLAQAEGGRVITSLYNGNSLQDPTTVVTQRTVEAIHWQGLQRRTFGNDPSEAAVEALPAIYENVGWSWAEKRAIANDPAEERRLWEGKMTSLNTTLGALKESSPADYEDLTGVTQIRTDHAMLEAGYSVSANVFRGFAAALRIACIVALFILGIMWVAGSPWLVSPQGESAGRGLLNSSLRAIGYAVISTLASFGYGIWAYYAMAPTVPTGMSIVLLIVGTVMFWSITRPDRKLLSLVSGGRVTGFGGTQKYLMDKLGTYLAVRAGTDHVSDSVKDAQDKAQADPVGFEAPMWNGTVEDKPWARHSGAPEVTQNPSVIDGEAWEVPVRPEVGTKTSPRSYEQPSATVQYGEIELYQRPVKEDSTP